MEDRLRHFKGLIEAGSFTGAARELHISQPALSASIAKLEHELGVRLLNRRLKPITATPAGNAAYLYALEHELHVKRLKNDLAILGERPSELHIGMIDSLAALFCSQTTVLNQLEAQYQLSLSVDASGRLAENVRLQKLDYACIVAQSAANTPLIGREPLLHVIATMQRSSPPMLLCYNRDSTTFQLIEQHFAAQKTSFQPAFYSTSPEVILQLVLLGRGSAVLPFLMVREALMAGRLTLLPIGATALVQRPVAIVSAQPHPSLDLVHRTLRRQLAKLSREAHSFTVASEIHR